MRNPERIDHVLAEIRRVWMENPDLRLAQIIENLQPDSYSSLYHMEDDELLAELWRVYGWPT